MVLSFMAENNLPFTMAQKLIDLSKELSRDTKALQSLNMSRTAASYKMRLGLGQTIDEDLSKLLEKTFFSINIDEATNEGSLKKVLTFLVSFYHPTLKKIAIRHLASTEMIVVNAEQVYTETEKIFQQRGLSWEKTMSVLLDSCGVMRGKKTGLEKRIRDGPAPHLLDIDGDSLHHVHNASKRLTKPFDGFLEKVLFDVFADLKYSTDLRDFFKEICNIINVSGTMPVRYVPTRWLTIFDAVTDFLTKIDAYTIFYYSFLIPEDKQVYEGECVKIYRKHDLTDAAKQRLRQIQIALKKKKVTDDGENRKKRCIIRLFTQRKRTILYSNFFSSVMPLLKNYVLLFQSSTPLIHILHDKQEQLLKEFLSCFVKPELIQSLSSKKLKKFEITQEKLLKSPFTGSKAKAIIESARRDDNTVREFMTAVNEAYFECGKYLIEKMPVGNRALMHLSALDPKAQGSEGTLVYLKRLPSIATNVIEEHEIDLYEREVHQLQVDNGLPSAVDENEKRIELDVWWSAVAVKYPMIGKMVFALMSCFHCPVVESSFSVMKNVMDETTNRMNVSTLSAIQSVKYSLSSASKTSIKAFRKNDFRHDRVDPVLVKNMQTAGRRFKEEKAAERQKKDEKMKQIGMKRKAILSKKKNQEKAMKLAKKARLSHVKKCTKT